MPHRGDAKIISARLVGAALFLAAAPLRGCSSSRCTMHASLFLAAAPLRGWVRRGTCMDEEFPRPVAQALEKRWRKAAGGQSLTCRTIMVQQRSCGSRRLCSTDGGIEKAKKAGDDEPQNVTQSVMA